MRIDLAFALGLGLASFLACAADERGAESARANVQLAIEHGDQPAALAAIAELRASLPDTPDALLEIAQLRVAAGDAPRAAWLLEQAVRRHSDRDDLRLALARVALILGNPSLANEAVLPVAPASEQHPFALILRAQAELNLGDLERALATLAEAERLYPERPEARLVRISTLLSERRQDEARNAIDEARAAFGEGENASELQRLEVTLAQLQARHGEPEAAIDALQAMLTADPADTMVWHALVQVLAQVGRSQQALDLLQTALELEDRRDLQPLVASVNTALGRFEEAEAILHGYAAESESAAGYLPLVNFHSVRNDAAATGEALGEAISRFPDDATLRMLHTETLLAQERQDAAREAFRAFRENTFEGDPQIEYLWARLELAAGDNAGAAARLTKLAPLLDRAATQFWLGRALELSGDSQGARRRYGLAQQRDPHWSPPVKAMIALEERGGAWRAVLGHARRLVQSHPLDLDGWIAAVAALENLREGVAAEQTARQCLERFPDAPEAQLLLARALRVQGRYDDALEALAAAESRGGDGTQLTAERILTLGMARRVSEGLAVADRALASEPEAVALHSAHAALLFAAGEAELGAEATERALALDPDEPRPLRVRCEFRASVGDWPSAREDCTRYLEARPDDAGAEFLLGIALQWLGERRAATEAYRRAASLDEHDARPRNNLAELLAEEGDLEGALAAAQEAYRLEETNPYVMDTLGALYLKKGLAERAVSLLQEARTAAPELGEVTLHLALAYRDTGRTSEARALLVSLQQAGAGNSELRGEIEEALHSLP